MRLLFRFAVPALLLPFLLACETAPERPMSVAPQAPVSDELGVATTSVQPKSDKPTELTSEMVFNLLAGEVAAQRGALEEAYSYQYQAALLSRDARSAERATRLAVHMEKDLLALKAARLWVKLAPGEMAARQLLVVLQLRQDKQADVLAHLKAIVDISDGKDENGFLAAMSAISRELGAEDSVALMRRLVAEYPEDPQGRYALVITSLVEKDYVTAEEQAQQLVHRHADWPNGYLLQARVQIAQERKEKAREMLAEAVERFPEHGPILTAYARLLVEAKMLEPAYQQFLRLEQSGQGDSDTYYWLGLLALELGEKQAARGYFQTLIDLHKRTDVAAYYLGRIAEDEGESDTAIRWYKKVSGGEHSDESQARIVRLMAARGDLQEAFDWIRNMRVQYPARSARFYLIEAELLREHATPEQVMALFDQALDALPDNGELLYARGLYAATQNQVQILEQDMLQLLAGDPKNADALNALGYTLADQTDRYLEALDYIQRALALKPDSAAIMDSMGWVLYRLGRHQEAIGYLQQAYTKMPDPEIAAHLGEVLWVTGDQERAREVWRGVLEKTPDAKHVLEVMRRLDI